MAAVVNVPAYLARIGYSGSTDPTADNLKALHRAHMLSVPFENLDIGLNRGIACDEVSFLKKIVDRRRGGFCYELNGAFAALLRELGFRVTLLSARVSRDDGTHSPEFDHLALLVDLEESWLADVGFGDSFVEPLRMQFGIDQLHDGRRFRLMKAGDSIVMERADPGEEYRPQFAFSLQAHELQDFAGMCHYHQTSPESHFTQHRLCSLATTDGRTTLTDGRLIVTRNGQKEEAQVTSEAAWNAALKQYFGIEL